MDIDKRYIEILAWQAPNTLVRRNKWLVRFAIWGVIIMVVGMFIALAGHSYGIGISAAGALLMGIGGFYRGKENKKVKQAFLDYYEKNNALPPWPEAIDGKSTDLKST